MTERTNDHTWTALNGLRADLEFDYEAADESVGIMSDNYELYSVFVNGIDITGLLNEETAFDLQRELREYVESEQEAAREQAGEDRGIRIAEWHALALRQGCED